ncbi:MAG: thioredoxin domain-containing protein [Syntrophorhabdaceae bacterium]|nr:thioredoxin domain-containing protein [Syntrophorhabdaceae bacterium]MDD5242566.1 thioredoxin domain-containing protein [Syntrophorhabdaceae bacterium]
MTAKTILIIRKHSLAIPFMFFVFLAFLHSVPAAGSAAEVLVPAFGEGKVKVRLYTDYFCPPCRDMEPAIEPVISELIKGKVVNLTFADTPFYKLSSLYVRYFLYALNEKNDLEHALAVRRLLIDAAKQGLDSAEKLEALFKANKVALKPYDPKPTFDILSDYLKKDQVQATPSCVIETDGKTDKHVGGKDIVDALNRLKKAQPKK